MPHKRQKRSVRLAAQQAKGYNNPPSAADSLLPISTTTYHGEAIIPGPGGADNKLDLDQQQQQSKNNKRRKPSSTSTTTTTSGDLNGMSKSAYRILNAEKLRQEYRAEKKRKLEEEEAERHPNQKKKKGTAATTTTKKKLEPLPHESLATFNRRVEQEMRGTINATIQASKNVAKKTKEVLKDKDLKKKSRQTVIADDADEEWNGIASDDGDDDGGRPKYGADKKGVKRTKPTPEESIDPFAKRPKQSKQQVDNDEQEGGGGGGSSLLPGAERHKRGRTGKIEFDQAPREARGLTEVALAPPTLAKPARKGLLAKALSSASDGTTAPAGARLAEGAGGGGFAGLRLAGMEEPVGKHRLPVDPVMKALLDREREKAVRVYRELKEQKYKEKVQN